MKKTWADFIVELQGQKSLKAFVKELGLSYATVYRWINHDAAPSEKLIQTVSDYCGIPVSKILKQYDIPNHSLRMSEMSKRNRTSAKESDIDYEEFVMIPFYGTAGCGNANAVQEEPLVLIPRRKSELRRLYGKATGWMFVEASGDSMSPTIDDGALVLVDREDKVQKDGVFLLIDNDSSLIKRLTFGFKGKVSVTSDNKLAQGQDFVVDTREIDVTFSIIGRVRASESIIH